MKREIMKDREQLRKIVADADAYLSTAFELLEVGDVDMEQFKELCNGAARAVIVKSAVTSMEVMQ